MAITIVVGGHSRNIGKTSVVAGIIEGLRQLNWTAMKITQYGHGICSINGKSCHCSSEDHRVAVLEELDPSSGTDTSRFLAAGAQSSFWVRTKERMLFEAMPFIRRIRDERSFLIIESNSVLRFFQPDLYLQVLNSDVADFKSSANRYMDRSDAFVITSPAGEIPQWSEVSLKPIFRKPVFYVHPPVYITAPILDFVKSRILCPAKL